MEERIRSAIDAAFAQMGVTDVAFTVERPPNFAHGDYMTNAALAAAKLLGKKSHEIAETLSQNLIHTLGRDVVNHVTVAGPGFINLTLAREAVTAAVAEADAEGEAWGRGAEEEGKRVIVEYSNPNAFKEMHIGHLVGSVVGESVARLIENSGATLARATFGGDIGPNVAKALWGLQKRKVLDPITASEIGTAYAEGSIAYESDPSAKEEIAALNQAIYAGTERELMNLWRKGRDVSTEEFRRIWKLLGIRFDFEFFDSDTTEIGMQVVQDGLNKGIFQKSDGAVIYPGEEKGVHTMVFITSHNTPTYETKDVGLAFLKEERWPSDTSIIITGNEQSGRFKTVLAVLDDLAPLLAKKTKHLTTGFLKLASGKMSSREGNVITVAAFIRDVTKRASEKNEDPLIAEQVAIGAIKYMILRQAPGSDIIFDATKSLSLEGDSGPYLQYALVRAKSVLAKASGQVPAPKAVSGEPTPLERTILHFPEVASRASRELAPNLLVNYLIELAGQWNSFYAQERIIGGENEAHKLFIVRSLVQTLENGLTLLGIPTPEKM
ncbi:arginine--tRNA ligase [Candidatus Parcubacteria bacterium]|nr:arginine--tRNA ligase [Candidatus Parcubacteria bacterium]